MNPRFIYLMLVFLFAGISLSAQDLIIKNDAEEIKVRIIAITDSHIKYQPYDNPDGPAFFIAKEDVLLIRYENGSNEIITQSHEDNLQGMDQANKSELMVRRRTFYEDDTPLDIYALRARMANNPEALEYLNRGKSHATSAKVFGTIAGMGWGYAVGYFIGSAINKNSRPKAAHILVSAGIGLSCTAIAISFNAGAKKNYQKAATIYNTGLHSSAPQVVIPSLSLSVTENGVGFVYTF